MDRRMARETAFILLFQKSFRKDEAAEDIKRLSQDYSELESDDYVDTVFQGASEKMEELDELIAGHAIGWKTGRMSRVSLTIMRLAVYEMLYMDDIPFNVSIYEAVELAKKFDHEKSTAFINGVLNSIADDKGLKGDETSK